MSRKHGGLLFAGLLLPLTLAAQTTQPPNQTAPPPAGNAQPAQAPPGDAQVPVFVPPAPQSTPASPEARPDTVKAAKHPQNGSDAGDKAAKDDNDRVLKAADLQHPVLWHDPGNIASLDLFYGAGGKAGQPVPPFTFEEEDKHGTNPKFDARDANGTKWRVKLGVEARPEVVASRLLWAMGYYVNDDYVLESADVQGLHLSRGQSMAKHGHIEQARFARKPEGQKKIGIWQWKDNPFMNTREFNGLRVMMALFHNWDLKDDNNARYKDKATGREIYYVTDLGASFGTTGKSYTEKLSKNNLEAYRNARFLSKVTPEYVSFNFPTHPALYRIFDLPTFIGDLRVRWIGRHIPRQDVQWIASLLSQLSPQQIRDAFRASGYSPEQVEEVSQVFEARIAELAKL